MKEEHIVSDTVQALGSDAPTSRRTFLRLAALTLGASAAGLAGCAAPTPQVKEVPQTVEVTRVVEVTRPVEVIKTVEVPKEVIKEVVKPVPPLPYPVIPRYALPAIPRAKTSRWATLRKANPASACSVTNRTHSSSAAPCQVLP